MATKKVVPKSTPAANLQDTLAELRKDLTEARRSHAANELPNPRVIRNNRREIARTLTAMQAAKKEANNA